MRIKTQPAACALLSLWLLLIGIATGPASAAEGTDGAYEALEQTIHSQFARLEVAGMAVAVVDGDALVYFKGMGTMNAQKKLPVEADTIFLMASITKTVTGTAVMQLAQDGRINLDENINVYLPFIVRNPSYPDTPVTARMLLCHTSSIADNWDVLDRTYSYSRNPAISLQEFCSDYFAIGGKWYDGRENFLGDKPGTVYEYSNCGYALLGYLVEYVTGLPFYAYCDENIFTPLGMQDTSLMLEDLDAARIAVPYADGSAVEHYTFATYPDGGLRTSCEDFAKFVAMMMNGGTYQGAEILKAETVQAMLTPQFTGVAENQGLTWDLAIGELYGVRSDGVLVGHNGGEEGADTLMFFNPQSRKGAMILINEEVSERRSGVYNLILQQVIDAVND